MQCGVSFGRSTAANTHWREWAAFVRSLGINPFLKAVQNKIPILQVFLHQVRSSTSSANRDPVRSQTAEDYLRSIGQTFLAVGKRDPRLDTQNQIDFSLRRMLKAYSKKDPPPNRVKPVPIMVICRIFAIANNTDDPFTQAVADMIGLAFFFLLRPGEYTDSPSDTSPFSFPDVQMWIGMQRLDLPTASTAQLHNATFFSLTFRNQKNSVRGEVIGLLHSNDPLLSPTRIIARRILHLCSHYAPDNAPLACVYSHQRHSAIKPNDITSALQATVTYLTPASLGFLPSDVLARCLLTTSINALLCASVDTDVICLLGRWRSDEMLRYLHLQAAPLMHDFSKKMLAGGTFTLVLNQLIPCF